MRCHGCKRKRPFPYGALGQPLGYEPGWKLLDRLTHWYCPECLDPSQGQLEVGA